MRKILFFDDFLIHREHTIKRVMHAPNWRTHKPYTGPTRYGVGYSSVVAAPQGGFFLYYTTMSETKANPMRCVICMAWSKDGVTWKSYALDKPADPELPNCVLAGDPAPHGVGVFDNNKATGKGPRYLMTTSPVSKHDGKVEQLPSVILASDDGIKWERIGGVFHPYHSDTMNSLLWNPRLERYQITMRQRWGERRIFIGDSPDLETWTTPRMLLSPESIDRPSTHFYGMPQFYLPSADMFVGFLWHLQMPYNNISGGPNEAEYTWSYDGNAWLRSHELAITRLERGQFGGGSIYPSEMIEDEDGITVYAAARISEHNELFDIMNSGKTDGALLSGRLRTDGFVSLQSESGWGEITTENLLLRSENLHLNLKAPLGTFACQICDSGYHPIPGYTYADCLPITGDHTKLPLRWREHADLCQLRDDGRWFRLQIKMRQSELFSIAGDFEYNINPGGICIEA